MTFLISNSLDRATPQSQLVAFAFASWFDSRYILDDDIMRHVSGDHLSDDIELFVLDCDDFRSQMCAVDTDLKTSSLGHRTV